MSIRARFEDSLALYRLGRHEGALQSVLLALAATARLRFPQGTLSDAEAFQTLFHELFTRRSPLKVSRVRVAFRGEMVEIERIFYRYLRCRLVHEGALPRDVQIVFERPGDTMLMFQAAGPGGTLRLGLQWIDLLLEMVASAPENATAFADLLQAHPLPARA